MNSKDPLHVLDLVVQLNEAIKRGTKSEYGDVTKGNVDLYCNKYGVSGAYILKMVRGDYVHSINKLHQLRNDVAQLTVYDIGTHLKHLNVSYSEDKLEADLLELNTYLSGLVDASER